MKDLNMTIKTRGWPEKRRKEQAERCRKAKPWKHNTGPKTEEGKVAVRNNALKHGMDSRQMKEIDKMLSAYKALLKLTK